MFDNLVESSSHKDDLARKGSFILGTVIVYAVLLTGAGIASILFYEAHLDNQNLELTTLVAPVPIPPQQSQPDKPADAAKQPQKTDQQVDVRQQLIADTDRPDLVPKETSAKASDIPPVRKGVTTVLGGSDSNTTYTGGPVGSGTGSGVPGGTGTGGPIVKDVDEPPPPPPTPKPPPRAPISGGVLNGKAISMPKPAYPPIAKSARAQGVVTVQITLDESGRVVSASAVSGHPLLRAAAVQAAYQARFSPTLLSGQPVKVTGTITYNFTLQ